jgi:truncated hemoglobin YjbI
MAAEAELDLLQELGGLDGCRRLSNAFYARVAKDPVLRPIFPGSFHCAIPAFASFLAQFLGGPCEYTPQRWWLSMYESHLRFRIGLKERDAWVENMRCALEDVGAREPAAGILRAFFEQSATHLVNQVETVGMANCVHAAIAGEWNSELAIDEAVAAVRRGDGGRAVALAEGPILQARFGRDPASWVSLLAILCGGGALQDYLREKLLGDPTLSRATYARGRTLLHAAAAAGNLPIVELLLQLGAVPDMVDAAGHTALYCVGNGCSVAGGGDVVRALVRAGANVDAQDGVKRCTALHMAARRGNVEVAGTLLDSGAAIEARDSLGDTPLRRAVNCGKVEVAALLVARGADCHSRGSKQLTPLLAARTAAMKRALGAG